MSNFESGFNRGIINRNRVFKRYPKLYVNSYQGSLTSNSSEIQTIFKRAKNISKPKKKTDNSNNEKNENDKNKNDTNNNEKTDDKDAKDENKENKNDGNNKNDDNNNNNEENRKKIISVILFDEMGLAEISPNNPLKVIHSELDNNDEIGFVGISNCSLDASKMNRGVHLSIPEPDKKDLIDTANIIANGIIDEIKTSSEDNKVFENLAKSYYDYKKLLLEKFMIFYDFHGARDFYNLIKIAARMIKRNKQNSIESIAMESIERNFGGLELEDKGDNNNTLNLTVIPPSFNPSSQNFKKYRFYFYSKKLKIT